MSNRTRGQVGYAIGRLTVVMVCASALPLLLTEFSWAGIGILLAALAAGLGCTLLGWFMKRIG